MRLPLWDCLIQYLHLVDFMRKPKRCPFAFSFYLVHDLSIFQFWSSSSVIVETSIILTPKLWSLHLLKLLCTTAVYLFYTLASDVDMSFLFQRYKQQNKFKVCIYSNAWGWTEICWVGIWSFQPATIYICCWTGDYLFLTIIIASTWYAHSSFT